MRGGLNKFLKHEQIFYGDILRIFQESSPITLSSSSIFIISVCSTQTVKHDFDLFCFHTNERHQYHKGYARYEHNLCLASFTFLGGLSKFCLL